MGRKRNDMKAYEQFVSIPQWNTPLADHKVTMQQVKIYLGGATTIDEAIQLMSQRPHLVIKYEPDTQFVYFKNEGGNMVVPVRVTLTDSKQKTTVWYLQLGAGMTLKESVAGFYGPLTFRKNGKRLKGDFVASPAPEISVKGSWQSANSEFVVEVVNTGGTPHEPLDVYYYQGETAIGSEFKLATSSDPLIRRFRTDLASKDSTSFNPDLPVRVEILGFGSFSVPVPPREELAETPRPRFQRHEIVSNGGSKGVKYFLPITSWSTTNPRSGLMYRLELVGIDPKIDRDFYIEYGKTVMLLIENLVPNRQVGIWIDGELYGFEMVPPPSGFSFEVQWKEDKLWIYITRDGESMTEKITLITNNTNGGTSFDDELFLEEGRMQPILLTGIKDGDYVEMRNQKTGKLLFAFVAQSKPNGNIATHSLTLVHKQPTCM